MSPSRTRKPQVRARPRAEVITAVAAAVGIVGGTVLIIWLMRPGDRPLLAGGDDWVTCSRSAVKPPG